MTNAAFTDLAKHDFIWSLDAWAEQNPYYLSLGGFVYKLVNSDFYGRLENSMNPRSESFQSLSASWEVGFNTFGIAVGGELLKDCEIIINPIHVAELSKHLKSFGGAGITDKGERIYRLILGEVYPLGVGFVENPAAEVRGIESVDDSEDEDERHEKEIAAEKAVFIPNKEAYISQSEKNNVKTNDLNISMDLLTQIREALAAEEKISEKAVANLTDKFADAIREGNAEYQRKIDEEQEKAATAEQAKKDLEDSVAKIKDELKVAQEKIKAFEDEKNQEALATAINQRLEQIDATYELDDEERKVVLDDLNNINVQSDEEFEAFANKLAVMWKSKSKEFIEQKEKANKKAVEEAIAKALSEESKGSEEKKGEEKLSEEEALAKAEEDKTKLANNNASQQKEPTLAERYKSAFAPEEILVQ